MHQHARTAFIRLIAVFLLLVSPAAFGQPNEPERERGFKPDLVYQLNGIDSINLFNGNLNLTLPLASYSVSSEVSYAFTLIYSGNIWRDLEHCSPRPQTDQCRENWLIVGDNGGVGWGLGFGELETTKGLYGPDSGTTSFWQYVSPDRSEHNFYDVLHEPACVDGNLTDCDVRTEGVRYTRDGTYLRMKDAGDAKIVEFPNGMRQRFRRLPDETFPFRLQYIYGASSELNAAGEPVTNWVKFEYSLVSPDTPATVNWHITDSIGRSHDAFFLSSGKPSGVLDRLVLAASDGPAVYDLTYNDYTIENGVPVDGPPTPLGDPYGTPGGTSPVNPSFLSRIDLPSGEVWDFKYHRPPACCDSAAGTLIQATLPTLGNINWTYQSYVFSSPSGEVPATGVRERCMRSDSLPCDVNDQTSQQVQYALYTHAPGSTTVETFTPSSGGGTWRREAKVVNFFDRSYGATFGLPFTKDVVDQEKYLSTETYQCDPATDSCRPTPEKRTYVRFELDYVDGNMCLIDFACARDRNRRVIAERTRYVSDSNRYADTNYSSFDGLGHFRLTSTDGNFTSGNRRDAYIGYNENTRAFAPATFSGQSVGTYRVLSNGLRGSGFTMLENSDSWILGTYSNSYVWETDANDVVTTAFSESCFDPRTGFLARSRAKAGLAAGNHDLLSVYTRDPATGYATREETFGGDLQTVSTSSLCTLTPPSHDANNYSFRIDHTFQYGVLKTSRSAGASFYSVNNTVINQNTGQVTASEDGAGLATTWSYDNAGRLQTVSRPGVAPTTYQYQTATATSPARVSALTGSGDLRTEQFWEFDPFGRIAIEKKLMPDGTWSGRKTVYDAVGRRVSVSEQETAGTGTFEPVHKTTYANYDVFGRTGRITGPDGKSTTFTYIGDRIARRTFNVAQENADADVTVEEERDRAGRLIRVTEDATGTAVATHYKYDVGNRLAEVLQSDGTTNQTRTFTYDQRGLLVSERHPESGLTTYAYNSRGQVITRTNPVATLEHEYDGVGRIKRVSQSGVGELKVFTYDRANSGSDRSLGKVDTATRHNRSAELGDVTVAEKFFYGQPGGRLSKKETTVAYPPPSTDAFTFSTDFTYNAMGDLDTLEYPRCTSGCPSLVAPPRTVSTTYRHGMVTDVPGYTQGITYHPNGALHTIRHQNADGSAGPLYTQTIANGMARTDSITVSNFCDEANLKITQRPQNRNVATGSPAGLSVTATADGNPSYQWFRVNGTSADILPDQQTATLTTIVTAPTTFFVRVGNGSCTVDSERATVTVGPCPPPDATITAFGNVTAGTIGNASVPDTPGATYIWTITGGMIVSGATEREVTFRPDGCSGNVTLTAKVTTCTEVTSTTTLMITPPHAVVTGTMVVGGVTTIQALLVGAGPWSLMWSDGVPQAVDAGITVVQRTVAPTVTTTYTISSVTDNGTGCAGTTSGSAVVEVDQPPVAGCAAEWKTLPFARFQTILHNEATQLTAALKLVGAAETDYAKRYHFKWYEDGQLEESTLDSATDTDLHTVRFLDQTYVRVDGWVSCYDQTTNTLVATSPVISADSYGVIYGTCPVPEILIDQANVVLTAGQSITLSPKVPYTWGTYQWYEGESGNTRNTAWQGTSNNLVVTEPGTYWLRVTTDCGTHNDSPTITASSGSCSPVRILTSPQDATTAAGAAVPLSVTANGAPAPNYFLWSTPDGNIVNGPSSIVVNPIRTTDYAVRVGNGCSLVYSDYARVHVTSCAEINVVSQPADLSIPYGQPAALTIDATSVAPLRYQWYSGESGDTSNPLAAAIGSTLNLPTPVSQKYWVRLFFDDATKCAVDSRTVTVSVCQTPLVTGRSEYSNLIPNVRVLLGVDAVGENLTTQWFRGEVDDETDPISAPYGTAPVWPMTTTKYWAKVTSDCTPPEADPVVKFAARVSVCPTFRAAPVAAKTIVMSGTTTTISVDVDRGDLVKWFMTNASGVTTELSQTGATITTPPITGRTTFSASATSGACTMPSESVTIDLCSSPTVHWAGGLPTRVAKGESFWLSAGLAPGETATWKWYRGATSGDVVNSTLIYQSSNAMQVAGLDTTTSYWVRATDDTSGCSSDTTVRTVYVCVPTIVTQPQSQTINAGATATLTAASDLPGMKYDWYRGAVGDTTNLVLTQTPAGLTSSFDVTPSATTTYWVRVTGCTAAGLSPVTRDSAAATVTICQVPAITGQPVSVWASSSPFSLSVTATGTELTYQWYKGLSGDTSLPQSSTASTFEVNPSQTTNYWVRVSGRCGTPLNSVTAKISKSPTITAQPVGGLITKGTTRALTVTGNGTELSYQWYQQPASGSPTAISGATAASYTPPAIQADATYFARVYSGIAYTTSADATFTVCLAREINVVGYPSGQSGAQVTLQVINPAADEQFEWYSGPSGVTSAPLGNGTLKYVNPSVTTQYWVRTKRTACDADSAAVTINICYPAITTQPASSLIAAGTTKTLTVAAIGTAPLVYQWYRGAAGDTSAPVGTNSNTFTTPALTATTTYWVRITTNASVCSGKYKNSDAATVTVCQPPAITAQPQANIVNKNLQYTLSVTATGEGLHYQWYIGNAGVTTTPVGTDSNQLAVTATATRSYWVRVTGTCGVVNSVAALQSVKPIITQHPVTADICGVGGMATFSVTATGADSYEWYRNWDLVGTSQTLTIAVPDTSVGFRAVVRSGAASATSQTVGVNVLPLPLVTAFTATQETTTRWLLRVTDSEADSSLLRYKFYEGALGDTTTLLIDTGNSYYRVYPSSRPKTYWVSVYLTTTGCATNRAVTIN